MKVSARRVRLTALLLLAAFFVVAASAIAQDDVKKKNAAARDFNVAAAMQNNGLYSQAVGKWETFLQKYPGDDRLDRVYYYLGVCQLHTKKYAEAAKTFETVLTKYPQFANADGTQYNLAMARYQAAIASDKPDDFKKAADAFGTVASKFSKSKYAHKALYFQGESLYSAADIAGAAAAYQKLIKDHPNSSLLADAYYALGTAQQDLQKDDEAAKTFAEFLANKTFARHDLVGEIRLRLGMSLFNQKKFAEAEPLFAEIAKQKDAVGRDFAMLRQGQCKLEEGDDAAAAKVFAEFLKKFPNSEYKKAAQLAAGKCFYLAEKYDDAKRVLQPLVSGGNAAAEESYWLARTFLKTKQAPDALKVLDQAIGKSDNKELAPYLELARVDAMYDIPDRRKETAKGYENFIQKHPKHPLAAQATYMAALAALGAEDYATARKHAESFLGNPFNSDSELRPAVMYIAAEGNLLAAQADQGGDVAKAEATYRELVAKHPNHARAPRAHLRIGWCLYQDKKHDDAAKYLSDVANKLKDPEHKAEAQLLIGRNLGATDKHKEAVQAFERALQAKGDWSRNDEVLLAMAASLRSVDDPSKAGEHLKRLVRDFPNSTYKDQAVHQLGEIAQELKNHDEAISHFNQVAANANGELGPAANYGLAASYFAKEQYDQAVQPLSKLLDSKAKKDLIDRGRYLRGLIYQRQKKYEPAAADLAAFLASGPKGDEVNDARYALVICQIHLGKADEARKAMDDLVKANPNYAHIDRMYYELAHAMMSADKLSEATDAFRALAEKFPGSSLAPESWFHVGRQHETAADAAEGDAQKAEVAKAADAYAAGLKNAKEAELREKLQYKLGDMQFRQEKYEEAAATLQKQLADHPGGSLAGAARYLAGESLFKLKQYDKALPLFAKVADDRVEKYQAHSLYRAGDCAAKVKNWAESQKRFDALIKQFADFEQISEARYGLAWALQNLNKTDEARAQYEKVTEETETETAAKARFMIGEIDFGNKKYTEAIEQYLMVAVGYAYPEWQALAQLETGRCFMELGEKDKAIAALQKMVDKFPDHPKADAAKQLIEELKK